MFPNPKGYANPQLLITPAELAARLGLQEVSAERATPSPEDRTPSAQQHLSEGVGPHPHAL